MRFIALDVHRDFCEVAISDGGRARSAGRIKASPQALQLFAGSLARMSTEKCRSVITESCRSVGSLEFGTRAWGEEPRRGDDPRARVRVF